MSHILALLSRVNEDVTPKLLSAMRKTLCARGENISILLSSGVTKYRELPKKLEYSSSALAMTGEHLINNTAVISNTPKQDLFNNFQITNPRNINAPYSVVQIGVESLTVVRDIIGTLPLYLGKNQKLYAISTHMKSLWEMGLDATSILPGNLLEISTININQKQIRTISQPTQKNESITNNVKTLNKLLQKIIKSMIPKDGKVALGFSGGIDSTLLAYYLKQEEIDISLICVSLENSSEFKAAEKAALTLDLPLNIYKYPTSAVKDELKRVLWIIEDYSPVNVGIGISLVWAASRARELGNGYFFSGGGADELFGGYHRYLGKPPERVKSMIFNDVVNSYKINYERDYKVCHHEGLNLMIPFADIRLIEYGLSIPISQKLPENPSAPRKIVLRMLAKKLGIPQDVYNKPKKAFQYSTGVNKELLKIAQKNDIRLSDYLKTKFNEIKKERLLEGSDDP